MTDSLAGHTALVTGASSGLGRHFARLLASRGVKVAIGARRMDRLVTLAEEIRASGGEALLVELDVTDEASVTQAVGQSADALGGLDILVNNAGIVIAKPALEMSIDEWDAQIATNLRGVFLVARTAARRMAEQGGGSIINIASIAGLRTGGHISAYAASKAGLIHLTRNLAIELARSNVRVNALAPGYIETELNAEFFASKAGEELIKRIPQRRLGRPEDLDGPLLLLASDASRYMTGAVLVVDGGHSVNPL
ncbi:MAG: SDR family oxidoreductase [Alphaproteobacteria bacterium]|nr:SDR family oxidoreductase [Alphaproteobacteria bacterium]